MKIGGRYGPCRVRDWKMFFDPTFIFKGAFTGFGEQVLLVQIGR
jgi:hypothetical protein